MISRIDETIKNTLDVKNPPTAAINIMTPDSFGFFALIIPATIASPPNSRLKTALPAIPSINADKNIIATDPSNPSTPAINARTPSTFIPFSLRSISLVNCTTFTLICIRSKTKKDSSFLRFIFVAHRASYFFSSLSVKPAPFDGLLIIPASTRMLRIACT